jgi:hypothetical protein
MNKRKKEVLLPHFLTPKLQNNTHLNQQVVVRVATLRLKGHPGTRLATQEEPNSCWLGLRVLAGVHKRLTNVEDVFSVHFTEGGSCDLLPVCA